MLSSQPLAFSIGLSTAGMVGAVPMGGQFGYLMLQCHASLSQRPKAVPYAEHPGDIKAFFLVQ